MKILAVDDDPFILDILPALLAAAGFNNTDVCLSAEDALSKIGDDTYEVDCFFLDIKMPGMDGNELCKKIRSNERFAETPIIMLTAMSDKAYIDEAFTSGATDYITKPFNVTTVGVRARIAEKLIIAQNLLKKTTPVIHKPKPTDIQKSTHIETLPKKTEVSPSIPTLDSQWFEMIEGAIRYDALINYLNQLSKSGLDNTNVFAVKIDQAQKINAQSTPSNFLHALTEIAGKIAEILRSKGFFLLSYAGSGHFVCISHSEFFETESEAGTYIQDAINAKPILSDKETPMEIEISMGKPVKPLTTTYKQTERIFRAAIARADAEYEKKQPYQGNRTVHRYRRQSTK